MDEQLLRLTDESISLELLVSELYMLFHTIFPEDAKFWWRLVEEERNHAALIRSAREYFDPVERFPLKLISQNLPVLEEANRKVKELLERYSKNYPERAEAFNCALRLERTAGEVHFQNFLDDHDLTSTEKIFQKLNGDDGEHTDRILAYMKLKGLPLSDDETE